MIEEYVESTVLQPAVVPAERAAFNFFSAHDFFYQPWLFTDNGGEGAAKVLPKWCFPATVFSAE